MTDMTHSTSSISELTAEQLAACAPIEQYFLGHAHDDASYMRQAFLPSAHIESMREGVFTSWPLDVYVNALAANQRPTKVRACAPSIGSKWLVRPLALA